MEEGGGRREEGRKEEEVRTQKYHEKAIHT